jgi:hypothetical protein
MNKLVALFLLVGGVVAFFIGVTSSNSIGSAFSRLFTGAPTDKAIWLLLGGGIAAAVGTGALLTDRKSS